jgi:pilus assembly protein CpaE
VSDLFLAAAGDEWEALVRKAFNNQIHGELRPWNSGAPEDVGSTLSDIKSLDPLVVTVGPALPNELALKLCKEIDFTYPEVCIVLVGEATASTFELALKAGVRDVVASDAPPAEIKEVLERALDTARRRRANLATGPEDARVESRVIAVVSPKGGAGKTAISTNLAVGLAREAVSYTHLRAHET